LLVSSCSCRAVLLNAIHTHSTLFAAIPLENFAMRRQRSSLNPPQPIAEIDLHGFTRADAIQRLTVFLDEVSRQSKKNQRPSTSNTCWVLVITGSGAHSPYGPVLRTAVEELLQKRQMQYVPQRGKGGFTVNANSGIVFFEPSQPTDSKVVISHESASLSYASILAKHRDRVRSPPTEDMMKSEPLPAEVAATDSAIKESRMDAQREQGKEQKEKHQLQKALSMSALEQHKEEEEEANLLEKAMSLSILEGAPEPNENEEEELQKALLASQQEEEEKRREQQREEELMLQQALSVSVLETRQERDEEEELLQKALSLSKLQDNNAEDEVEAALEASMKEYNASYFDYVPHKTADFTTGMISYEKDGYDAISEASSRNRRC